MAPGITTVTSLCSSIHFNATSAKDRLSGIIFFNFSTAINPFLKFTPEKVSPTSKESPFML